MKTASQDTNTGKQYIVGGVSVLVRVDLARFTDQITRENHRILTVTLKYQKAVNRITIITTYAHRQQYKKDIKDEHCQTAQETLDKTPTSHLIIWGRGRCKWATRIQRTIRSTTQRNIRQKHCRKNDRPRKRTLDTTNMSRAADDTSEHVERATREHR